MSSPLPHTSLVRAESRPLLNRQHSKMESCIKKAR